MTKALLMAKPNAAISVESFFCTASEMSSWKHLETGELPLEHLETGEPRNWLEVGMKDNPDRNVTPSGNSDVGYPS